MKNRYVFRDFKNNLILYLDAETDEKAYEIIEDAFKISKWSDYLYLEDVEESD